ncbi:SGNH/GDSL hydrolase family protein [Streptomyces enissocaesilis]|uniref:SGNH family lipase n=1 Tax=Streptomyces enissocaesilis TaxID=332589 RepID=A0ABN3XII3_9ACTN
MRNRVIAVLAALPIVLGGAPAIAAPTAQDETRYVALGDSYAAGNAAGAYDTTSGACRRSTRAYPALWAAQHAVSDFRFAACSGATTADVLRQQLPALSRNTTLVTLTIGGNDLEFSDSTTSCLLPTSTDAACDRALDESERLLREELPQKLQETHQAIEKAAPNAKVVVTGYPHLLETGSQSCTVGTPARRMRFNSLTDETNELTRELAEKQGFLFADVRDPFDSHGICTTTGRQEWITRLTLPTWASFHPTATGHAQGYLPPVTAAING